MSSQSKKALLLLLVILFLVAIKEISAMLLLRDNWMVQSSEFVTEGGEIISTREYTPVDWYPASVPSTVLAALVENGVYPDPYFGTNLKSIPGYYNLPWDERDIPEGSPFSVPYWYRVEFSLPAEYAGKNIWLHLHGINYRANIWLNGHQIADSDTVEGPYRLFDFNITKYALSGEINYLALEIFPPKGKDLSISWVDWNPTPPDKGMGIWYDVWISTTGSVMLNHPWVRTSLDLSSLKKASLTVSVELTNVAEEAIEGILNGKIENIRFSQPVKLVPEETRLAIFSPDKFPQLNIINPRLWWPTLVGPQNLYNLELDFCIEGKVSDTKKVRFGIREVSSYFNAEGYRVFQVNGKDILIRGGGWVDDMLLRPFPEKDDAQIRYAKQMNLNLLRMEGVRGTDEVYNLCDEDGIMVFVGLCCCCSWERWKGWTEHTTEIAMESWKDQVVRLRNHPGVVDWLYGSDRFPPPEVEEKYIEILEQYDGTRPYQSSATSRPTPLTGPTGVKMGPIYEYVVPSYWYGEEGAGAFGFDTETGPGAQVPPIESMRKMLAEEDLWPPTNEAWYHHSSTRDGHRRDLDSCTNAVNSRYGTATGIEDYCKKSQVLNFEGIRAMFEAYARNKYLSTGIIMWMFNSAWPSVCWQLFDWYLLPGGAFYGARKACEPLHPQYSYDDYSVYVVNAHYQDFKDLKVIAKVYNLDMAEKYSRESIIEKVPPDSSNEVFIIYWPPELSKVHFLKLELKDNWDNLISSNFYWLSTEGDADADFSDLSSLPEVDLNISPSPVYKQGSTCGLRVRLENPSSHLAFAVNPKIKKITSGDLVLPVYWEDNYFSLLPGETRQIKVEFAAEDLAGEEPVLVVEGWNVKTKEVKLVVSEEGYPPLPRLR